VYGSLYCSGISRSVGIGGRHSNDTGRPHWTAARAGSGAEGGDGCDLNAVGTAVGGTGGGYD